MLTHYSLHADSRLKIHGMIWLPIVAVVAIIILLLYPTDNRNGKQEPPPIVAPEIEDVHHLTEYKVDGSTPKKSGENHKEAMLNISVTKITTDITTDQVTPRPEPVVNPDSVELLDSAEPHMADMTGTVEEVSSQEPIPVSDDVISDSDVVDLKSESDEPTLQGDNTQEGVQKGRLLIAFDNLNAALLSTFIQQDYGRIIFAKRTNGVLQNDFILQGGHLEKSAVTKLRDVDIAHLSQRQIPINNALKTTLINTLFTSQGMTGYQPYLQFTRQFDAQLNALHPDNQATTTMYIALQNGKIVLNQ